MECFRSFNIQYNCIYLILNPLKCFSLTLQITQYELIFIYTATLLSFYTSLISEIQQNLERINTRLAEVCLKIRDGRANIYESFEIMKLIKIEEEMLWICLYLSNIFGVVMVNGLISIYLLIDLTHRSFLIVIILERISLN